MFSVDEFFSSGPFASASLNRQTFADGLYFSYLLNSSIQERIKLEQAHLSAIEDNDIVLATQKKSELDYLDGVFKLTLEIQQPNGGTDS